MPSKCLVQNLEEIIEDIKLMNEYYFENGYDEILEINQPLKFLIATISDILNDQIILKDNKEIQFGFYSKYVFFQNITGYINSNWDDFDKGLIWIIQRLNRKDFSAILNRYSKEIDQFYNRTALMIKKRKFILNCIEDLERNVKFNLFQEDLYNYKMRANVNECKDHHVIEAEEIHSPKSNGAESGANSVYCDEKEVMRSSFISMEAVDVKLLQERELRNDFGFINNLKYNSIRFINNLRFKNNPKTIKSDFSVTEMDDFENINITFDQVDHCKEDVLLKMEICPERGLISQNYSCIECGNGISLKDSLKCDFTGNYSCLKCHGGDLSINPIRILKNWDFKKYPISKSSKKQISVISYTYLINFPKINPKEFKTNEKFKNIQKLREKIVKLTEKRQKSAGKSDNSKQMEILHKLSWPKVHLLTSTNFYTIEDLIEIENGKFYENVLVPLYNLLKL